MKKQLISLVAIAIFSCNGQDKKSGTGYVTTGSIERIDPALDPIIDINAMPEIIAEGLDWSEGPVWVESQKMLLFSDVPRDTIFKWTESKGKEIYLTPSGYTDTVARGGETGSNGLILDNNGKLVLCQCGNRQMAKMDAALDKPMPKYISIANTYNGKKFNSPNDAVYNSKGELFFTDPPYGLEKQMDDPNKEIPFQGVYKVGVDGKVTLITDSLSRPNGVAFLAGERTLLVSNSDPDRPNIYAFDLSSTDMNIPSRIFYSAAGHDKKLKGLPDGMKVDKKGNVFATCPGGVVILNKDGKELGKIKLDEPASNVALSADEKTLYITNDMYVLRLIMRK